LSFFSEFPPASQAGPSTQSFLSESIPAETNEAIVIFEGTREIGQPVHAPSRKKMFCPNAQNFPSQSPFFQKGSLTPVQFLKAAPFSTGKRNFTQPLIA
jgi:hypothetical protein